MDSLNKCIESNVTKYNGTQNDLNERFVNICNKNDELGRILTENEIEMFKLVMGVVKVHDEFMDSLASVKPIPIN